MSLKAAQAPDSAGESSRTAEMATFSMVYQYPSSKVHTHYPDLISSSSLSRNQDLT